MIKIKIHRSFLQEKSSISHVLLSEMDSTPNAPEGDDNYISEDVSSTATDLNIRSKSVSSILRESGLNETIQKELEEMFLKSKSENDKIDGSDTARLKLSIELLERLISVETLENKFAKQLMDQIVIENLQAKSLRKLLRKCLEEIQQEGAAGQTLDCWLAVLGRVLSTIQTFDVFTLPAEEGGADTVTGLDFVSRAVSDICTLNWNSQIATSMCAMLKVSGEVSC